MIINFLTEKEPWSESDIITYTENLIHKNIPIRDELIFMRIAIAKLLMYASLPEDDELNSIKGLLLSDPEAARLDGAEIEAVTNYIITCVGAKEWGKIIRKENETLQKICEVERALDVLRENPEDQEAQSIVASAPPEILSWVSSRGNHIITLE
jgi:hypothetical protein